MPPTRASSKKWADKYGIKIEIIQINDYVESINQYTAGGFDGCSMTNMDALTIPAGGGVDTTALIIGDFSNGNDGIVCKDGKSVADLKGQKVNLVELRSRTTCWRARSTRRRSPRSDIDAWSTPPTPTWSRRLTRPPTSTPVVTWNPLLSEIVAMPGATKVFD